MRLCGVADCTPVGYGLHRMLRLGIGVVALGLSAACDLLEPTRSQGYPSGAGLLVWRNSDITAATRLTFDDRAVYTLGLDHRVAAIDKRTGTTLWQTRLTVSVPSRHGTGIVVASGRLIVGDIDLFALDPSSGNVLWTFSPSVGAWPGYDKQWTDGTTIVCGSATGHVYAVDAATGAERWVTHIVDDTNTNIYSPVVSDGVVYVGYTHFVGLPHVRKNGGVAALDFVTGRLLWAQLLPHGDSTDITGVWSDPDAIILTPTMVAAILADDKMYGLDRKTGDIVVTIPATEFSTVGALYLESDDLPSMAKTGNTIIVGSSTLTSLSARSANDLSRLWIRKFVFGSPTRISVDSDRIYSGAGGGQFAVYDLKGNLIWTLDRGSLRSDMQEGFYFPPAIDTDRIYLPGNYEVYAFKKK